MESVISKNSIEKDIEILEGKIIEMRDRVGGMIADSVKALVDRDKELAHKTIQVCRAVADNEKEIDRICLDILAAHRPEGGDLAFVALSMKVASDLERIGDLAGGVGERAIELSFIPPLKPYVDIPKMSGICVEMNRDVVDAFIGRNVAKAKQVIARDDDIDELYHITKNELIEIMKSEQAAVESGIRILSVSKYLERIGDHAVNIAQHIVSVF